MRTVEAIVAARAGLCLFGTRCGMQLDGRGGLDGHHADPVFLGGDPRQPLSLLCPNHHRRQHSLLRRLIEDVNAGLVTPMGVRRRFAAAELLVADHAVAAWVGRGAPPVAEWSVAAAA